MWTHQHFLAETTKAVAYFLGQELPKLQRDGWWRQRVLSALSDQQRDHAARRNIASLSGLDLAALLRVLDYNWNTLSANLKWPPEIRHFVREAQSIRNRWAHIGSDPLSSDDLYRDLDTLERLVKALGDSVLTMKLAQAKRDALGNDRAPPDGIGAEGEGTHQKALPAAVTSGKGGGIPPGGTPQSPKAPSPKGDSRRPDLVLIGCVKSKLPGRHKAKNLFISPLFLGRRQRAESSGAQWFILSAKYGLLPPETEVDSYDVSLNTKSRSERRRWSERVLNDLRKAVGSLTGKNVEIHAGAAYRAFGLIQGLEREGATVIVPLEHARQGEQLAWYAGAGGAEEDEETTDIPTQQVGASLAPGRSDEGTSLEIVSSTALEPFSYRWPTVVEQFTSGWDLLVRVDGRSHQVRYGIGRRHCYGRSRVHSVAWFDKHPMVEGAEAEDFAKTRDLVSVLKMAGGNRDAGALHEVDPAYGGFRVVTHRDAVHGRNARGGIALRIREDDLHGWALHAFLRARGRKGRGPAAAQSTSDPPPKSLIPGQSNGTGSVVLGLLTYGRSLTVAQAGSFTPDPKADAFVREDAFAFLAAVICDEQVRFEAAWEAPLQLRERLGHWDIRRIASEHAAVRDAFAKSPALHRWVNVTPDRIIAAAARVVGEYGGDARLIWSDRPSAQELRLRLERFDGIGQKKSAMAVELLQRELHVSLRDMAGSDIAVDVHVRRVFLRSGLADRDEVGHIVAAARLAHPEHPGELDYPAWEIGRNWCRPTAPDCPACPIRGVCPKLVDRAAGVRGA